MSDLKGIPNKLIDEKSPYLLQHAYNPVNWYPWDEEAFAKAKEEDKPVFLSIGYSTCHWCHVMELESFEDQEVADVLNCDFVAIKVDREERPDVDHIYMSVCQAVTGQGGWPLTIVMTGDKKPFFAGTYYPKNSKWGRPGLLELLTVIRKQWDTNREGLLSAGEQIISSLQGKNKENFQGELSDGALYIAYSQSAREFDARYGGFGAAPKFPIPHNLMFLMRYWKRTGKEEALAMVKKTLQAMRRGGIYDHLGFGFARYSTDARWLAPHFEKMLYDNALLCYAYLEAYQCTGETDFSQVASEIITYVLRDMTDGAGGFYSAEDADSEGVEGKFYVWSKAEIIEALGPEDGAIFAGFYEITDQGNFEHGNSILNYIEQDYSEYADKVHLSQAELKQVLAAHREKLYQLRKKRIPPYKDDKVLMAWNGLMIAALAKGARVLGRKEWALAAERGVNFIYEKMQREDGRFFARYREGEAAHLAYLDDYAFLLWGLLELYEATFKLEYIEKAVELSQQMKGLFWDEEQGGFFFYGTDGEVLLTKPKELYDGAIPSGNSVAILSLLRLGRMMNREEWLVTAEKALKSFAGEVSVHPKAYTYYLMGLEYYLSSPRQVVIAGEKGNGDTQAMLSVVHRCFLPDTVIVVNDPQDQMKIGDVLPHILEQEPVNGHAAAYICEDFACHPPLTTVAALHETLN